MDVSESLIPACMHVLKLTWAAWVACPAYALESPVRFLDPCFPCNLQSAFKPLIL